MYDDIANLGKSLSSENEIEIMTQASEEKIAEVINHIDAISSFEQTEDIDNYHCYKLSTALENPYEVCELVYRAFVANSVSLVKLNPVQTSLEDIFIELTSSEQEAELEEMDMEYDEDEEEEED